MERYKKKPVETDFEYGLRLIEIKVEQKPEDLEWSDIVELLGLDVHKDSLRKAASTTPYSAYAVMKYFKEKMAKEHCDEEVSQKLNDIYKATVLMRDERNELNRIKRAEARKQGLLATFKEIISKEVKPRYDFCEIEPAGESDNDLVIMLSDIHYGLCVDNIHNKYSPEIAEKRLTDYYKEIVCIADRYESENCYLFLGGDLINGAVRATTRISNTENVIEQVKNVSSLITDFAHALSQIFNKIYVHSVPGNHSRIFPNKEENQINEYLDNLIPFYMQAALQNIKNIEFYNNLYQGELCSFTVRGHKFAGVHGHHDTVQSVVDNMNKMIKETPDVILMGHRHANGLHTINQTKVIECGSLSSTDDYCMEKRLIGSPEQVVLVVSEEKCIESFCDVQLK